MRQPGWQWIWKDISLQNSTLPGKKSLVSDNEFNTAVQQCKRLTSGWLKIKSEGFI